MKPSQPAVPPASHAEAIRAHVERNIGRIVEIFPDAAADGPPIQVHHVGPSGSRPFHTLITAGLSDQPMAVPASQTQAPRYLELMMTLPEDWQLDPESRSSVIWNWPIVELQRLARLPHETGSWLGWGHTVPNGTPPRPFASNTLLCGVIIAPSLHVKEQFYELDVGNQRIAFFSAIALYREELELERKQGMAVLLSKLIDRDIKDVIHPQRKNVAKRRLGLF